ncbi:hypothetical protein POTOM_011614 [Populus tomentosa]|uniref:Uncharacterized protein n=1 Tax=Populus tomentosa TaxID=118781 RepID=A0A8X8A819_POPTO|nr:hypothetical protein POTOM_011614 [Populus tomentosa]
MEEADLLARSSKKIKVGRGKRPIEEESTVEEMEGNIAKGGFSYKESLMGWSTHYPMFWPFSFPYKKLQQLPITSPRTAATALACSPTSQLPIASTHAANVIASHALDRPLSKLSTAGADDSIDAVEFHRHCRSHQCCRIPHCPIVSSQHCFIKPWTVRCPSYRQPPLQILSMLPNSIDTADLISAAEFPTVSSCHPSTISSSLGQSSPKSQLSSAYCCASCCVLPYTHYADFRYCHASCHPVVTIQQCSTLAYALTDFNPVKANHAHICVES